MLLICEKKPESSEKTHKNKTNRMILLAITEIKKERKKLKDITDALISSKNSSNELSILYDDLVLKMSAINKENMELKAQVTHLKTQLKQQQTNGNMTIFPSTTTSQPQLSNNPQPHTPQQKPQKSQPQLQS